MRISLTLWNLGLLEVVYHAAINNHMQLSVHFETDIWPKCAVLAHWNETHGWSTHSAVLCGPAVKGIWYL